MTVRVVGLLLAVLAVQIAPWRSADAHPHVWIDLRTALVIDEAGRVTALQQEWLFDEFYSMYVYQGVQGSKPDIATALRELAANNLKNLEEYRYFTDVRVNDQRVEFGPVTEYDSEVRGNRIWMRFVVPLRQPVDPKVVTMRFAVYDPTYYIEVVYAKGASVEVGPLAEQDCRAPITPPSPSEEAVGLAGSLDKTESAGDTLGEMFAEWAEVQCR